MPGNIKKPSVIIIGAGTGGIATSARLAQLGFQVTVVEKHEYIGGRCSLIAKDGYRFDQGPSLVLLREIFAETFNDLGTTMEREGVNLIKCDPNYQIWFADHDTFELSTDLYRLKQEVERFDGPGSFPRLCAFLEEAGKCYNISMDLVLRRNYTGYSSMLRLDALTSLLFLRPWASMYGRAARCFKSEKLLQAWTFASMYMGMSPYQAPAPYNLLQYSETTDGIWYPRGGFNIILQALARIGERSGVNYRLNSPVETILFTENNRSAKGVRLACGETLTADLVVVNADLVYAFTQLLPPSSQARALKQRPASCSSISFYWAFNCVLPRLKTHNIFLADKYRESFESIFKDFSIPDDPSFYVNVPSKVDPTAAPPGKDAVIILVPVGSLADSKKSRKQEWSLIVDRVREVVLDTIEARTGLRDLRSKIVFEMYETPLTWQEKFNLDRGAILGLAHSLFNMLSFRPRTKHPSINGLYFVGASTHPGTGVPICLASGKLVAKQIMDAWTERREGGTARLFNVTIGAIVLLLTATSLYGLQPMVTLASGLSQIRA